MAAKTIRSKLIEALIQKGETVVSSKTRKYIVYTRFAGGFYYLGKHGGLRFGTTIRYSIPASEKFIKSLIGEKNGNETL